MGEKRKKFSAIIACLILILQITSIPLTISEETAAETFSETNDYTPSEEGSSPQIVSNKELNLQTDLEADSSLQEVEEIIAPVEKEEEEWTIGNKLSEEFVVPLEEIISIENTTFEEQNSENINIIENETSLEKQLEEIQPGSTFQEEIHSSNSETSASGGSIENFSVQENYFYENLEEITSPKINQEYYEKESIRMYERDGKLALEYEIYGNESIQIKKEDKIIDETALEIKVYSDIHFEDEVRVYSDLPSESYKEEISIIWENENINIENYIKYDLRYYDENKNNLVDRISWIIPHLSDQYFTIVINQNRTNLANSTGIILETISPINGAELSNPIKFELEIDYVNITNVNCTLELDGYANYPEAVNFSETNKQIDWPFALPNGNHSWTFYCHDTNNNSIVNSTNGTFIINETFSVGNTNYPLYLAGENVSFNIASKPFSNITYTIIKPNGSITAPRNAAIGNNVIYSSDLDLPGKYQINVTYHNLTKAISQVRNFSVVMATLSASPAINEINKNITYVINVNSPGENITLFEINYGDGSSEYSGMINKASEIKIYNHIYAAKANYTANASLLFGSRTLNLFSNKVEIKNPSGIDNTDPVVTLLTPSDDTILENTTIEFSYKVSDNIKVANCTLKVYNASCLKDEDPWDCSTRDLVFPVKSADNAIATKTDITNNTEVKVTLYKFEKRDYIWEVDCQDNSSNEDYAIRSFNVGNETVLTEETKITEKATTYERESEVQQMIDTINAFMEQEKTTDSETKKVIQDLGIIEKLKNYKNRLSQIDQDFKYNIDYIGNPDLKKQRIEEMQEEISSYNSKIPKKLEILDRTEYVKNNLDMDLGQVVAEYLEATKTKIDDKVIKKLIASNINEQNNIVVNSELKKVSIEYLNQTETLVLVIRNLDIDEETNAKKVLEYFPEDLELDNIEFLIEEEKISENKIYEFESVKTEKIAYYVLGEYDLKDFNKVETVLFTDTIYAEGNVLTGFSVIGLLGNGGSSITWLFLLILIVLIIILIYLAFKRILMAKWKQEPNFRRIISLIKDSRNKLKNNELESAKTNYAKMKEIYPLLPDSSKGYAYSQIKIISNAIDRRDINALIREYESAKNEFRKEDAQQIYSKISKVYKRLPPEYKEKVYNKIIKTEISI